MVAEKFGIPIVLCGFLLWYVQRLVNMMIREMGTEMRENFHRIEGILVKLINNAKASEIKQEHLIGKCETMVSVFSKLTKENKK